MGADEKYTPLMYEGMFPVVETAPLYPHFFTDSTITTVFFIIIIKINSSRKH
jgi:hypothetical protein